MNDELIELARRAVASPHFRPLRGMVGVDGTVILSTSPLVETSEIVEWRDGGTLRRDNREGTWEDLRGGGWLPDLSDPATLGCLHDLACAALGADVIDIRADIAPDMSGQPRAWWTARELRGRRVASGRVESLTLRAAGYVAALEAAAEVEQ